MASVRGGNSARRKIDDLARDLSKAKTLKVGFPEGATYPSGQSLPTVAAINEFGAPSRGQPPRPFFRRMIKQNQEGWPSAISKLLRTNSYDVKLTLDQAGEAIAGQLRQSIVDLTDPPLAASTVARKGFDKPLIDTSQMLKSVTYQVE